MNKIRVIPRPAGPWKSIGSSSQPLDSGFATPVCALVRNDTIVR